MTKRPSATAALLAFLLTCLGLLAYQFIGALLHKAGIGTFGALLLSIVVQGLLFAVPALLYYRRHPSMMPALRLTPPEPGSALIIALSAIIGVFVMNVLLTLWLTLLTSWGLTPSTTDSMIPTNQSELWMMLAASAIAPAVFEEILFRGFILPSLEPLGEKKAIWISGIMFALLHGRFAALPAHILMGVMLAYMVIYTDSLHTAILYHAIYNAAILVVSYLAANAAPAAEANYSVNLLGMAMLIVGWAALLRTGIRRGWQQRRQPLAAAEKSRLRPAAVFLLVIAFVLLLCLEGLDILAMLPEATV